jgi:hypothetical protein
VAEFLGYSETSCLKFLDICYNMVPTEMQFPRYNEILGLNLLHINMLHTVVEFLRDSGNLRSKFLIDFI